MREIKFRAINHETGEFVYGWLTRLRSGARLYMSIIVEDEEADERLTSFYIHDDKTIGQYTGLKDKNGVEIYEGDIMRSEQWNPKNYVVVFEDGAFGFSTPSVPYYVNSLHYLEKFDVIGNIHQHPELLGGKNET